MNELTTQNTELASDVGETTETSWTPPEEMSYEQYEKIGRTFQQINRSLAWWVGDWLVHGEKKFGEMYTQAIEVTDRSVESLMKYKAVAQRVGKEIRQVSLSWTHHFYVAYLEDDQKGDLLQMAADLGLSSRELKDVAKLTWDQRLDLLAAADNGYGRDDILRLLNKLRLGDGRYDNGDEPAEAGARLEADDDVPFSDLDDSDAEPVQEFSPFDGEGETLGLDFDTVNDWWERNGNPIKFAGKREIIWEGIAVRAGLEDGKPVLIWEEIP